MILVLLCLLSSSIKYGLRPQDTSWDPTCRLGGLQRFREVTNALGTMDHGPGPVAALGFLHAAETEETEQEVWMQEVAHTLRDVGQIWLGICGWRNHSCKDAWWECQSHTGPCAPWPSWKGHRGQTLNDGSMDMGNNFWNKTRQQLLFGPKIPWSSPQVCTCLHNFPNATNTLYTTRFYNKKVQLMHQFLPIVNSTWSWSCSFFSVLRMCWKKTSLLKSTLLGLRRRVSTWYGTKREKRTQWMRLPPRFLRRLKRMMTTTGEDPPRRESARRTRRRPRDRKTRKTRRRERRNVPARLLRSLRFPAVQDQAQEVQSQDLRAQLLRPGWWWINSISNQCFRYISSSISIWRARGPQIGFKHSRITKCTCWLWTWWFLQGTCLFLKKDLILMMLIQYMMDVYAPLMRESCK